MTGLTGSYLYMAPEVYRSEPYNAKVDIYSAAIIMYELFSMLPLGVRAATAGTPEAYQAYAHRVARGHREPLPACWPPALAELIQDCWKAAPGGRPTADELVQRLVALEPVMRRYEDGSSRGVVSDGSDEGGGCCCVM